MMGERVETQAALFYEFDLERHVPGDHLLRSIDRFVELAAIRSRLRPFYSAIGRPSIDPELMIRMLLIGYFMGIRSERRLCEEVHLNLAESRIRRVRLGALNIRLHVLRRHQHHLMAQPLQRPRPMMRRAARFHAGRQWRKPGKKRQHLAPAQPPAQNRLLRCINAMQLKYPL
jgi:hypothetical protein